MSKFIKLAITAFFFLIAELLNAQSFEGTMTYKSEYKFDISDEMKKMGVTEEALIKKMKTEGLWSDSISITYKGDNYIMYTSVAPAAWSIYRGKTNKLYSFKENDPEEICTVTDVSIDLEEHVSGIKPVILKTRTNVDVNGWIRETVRVTWKSGTYDYYYHPSSFKVDTGLYSNYIYDGWSGYLKISHALPIRVVKSINGVGSVTLTLSSFKEEKVDDKIFDIPELIPDPNLNVIKLVNRELMRIKK